MQLGRVGWDGEARYAIGGAQNRKDCFATKRHPHLGPWQRPTIAKTPEIPIAFWSDSYYHKKRTVQVRAELAPYSGHERKEDTLFCHRARFIPLTLC